MDLQPRIENINKKNLIGKSLVMSFANNRTMELWKTFMPLRDQIKNKLSEDLVSLQIYHPLHFHEFDLNRNFTKWALIEINNFDNIPDGFETFILEGGEYAVFDYKGSSNDNSIFQYIYSQWLPNSEYELDDRPHFEILGKKYKNNDPESEEEIWIPIKRKDSINNLNAKDAKNTKETQS